MLENTDYLKTDGALSVLTVLRRRWKVLGLNEPLRTKAVAFLKEYLAPEAPMLKYLVGLRAEWFLGGHMGYCPVCVGDGVLATKSKNRVTCDFCSGTGSLRIPKLHHGWGTHVRNALRQNGFGEAAWPVWSLDDYYIPLVDVAMGSKLLDMPEPELTMPLFTSTASTDPYTIHYVVANDADQWLNVPVNPPIGHVHRLVGRDVVEGNIARQRLAEEENGNG